MSDILKVLSEQALVRAIETNFFEFWAYLGSSPYAEYQDSPDMLRFVTGAPHFLFNGVARAQFKPENVDAKIDETLDYFKSRRLPFMWFTDTATRPADLGKRLEAHGLKLISFPGMAADLLELKEDLPKPYGLTIERVGDAEAFGKFCQVAKTVGVFPDRLVDIELSLGFGRDLPRRFYVGLLKGKPVTCSELFLGAGVAGIYWVGTVPEARRKGIGTEMALVPLLEARDLGYRVGILHSSEMGLGVYRRLGFKEHCKCDWYVWPPEMLSGEV